MTIDSADLSFRLPISLLAAVLLPTIAFAVGDETPTPPSPTPTTTECKGGKIYDTKTKSCIDASNSSLDDDQRYQAVRELSYAGAFDRATRVLDAFEEPEDDRALTYRGFIARSSGDFNVAMKFYTNALIKNPDNLLARSYMGQGLVEMGQIGAARGQLTEIRQRGGSKTWAEFALQSAIETRKGYSY